MPLRVRTIPTVSPTPRVVSPAEIQEAARRSGNPNWYRADVGGLTLPRLRIDQTQLRYETRQGTREAEFRFQDGTLLLTLSHDIFLPNNLSECERTVWLDHEREHVRDNEQLTGTLNDRIQRDQTLGTIFNDRPWQPRRFFNIVQQTIEQCVTNIFRELTDQARQRRDTDAEYTRYRQLVRTRCGGQR